MNALSYRLKTITVSYVSNCTPGDKVSDSKAATELIRAFLADLDAGVEHFVLVCTDAKNKIHAIKAVHQGGLAASYVDVALVLRLALQLDAYGIIIAHNHPSGDPTPSDQDRLITLRFGLACEAIGLRFLDSVILGDNSSEYFSFAASGLIFGK